MSGNYILSESETIEQYKFTGQKVYNILKYITSNEEKLNKAINMHSVLTEGKQTYILGKDNWTETENKTGFLKQVTVSLPCLIDKTNKHNINILVSPTEEFGIGIIEKGQQMYSEETCRELYTDYNIRCIEYDFLETETIAEEELQTNLIITFKSDDTPEYDLPINFLILYNRMIIDDDLDFIPELKEDKIEEGGEE